MERMDGKRFFFLPRVVLSLKRSTKCMCVCVCASKFGLTLGTEFWVLSYNYESQEWTSFSTRALSSSKEAMVVFCNQTRTCLCQEYLERKLTKKSECNKEKDGNQKIGHVNKETQFCNKIRQMENLFMNVVARVFASPAVFARKLIVCVTSKNYPYESF